MLLNCHRHAGHSRQSTARPQSIIKQLPRIGYLKPWYLCQLYQWYLKTVQNKQHLELIANKEPSVYPKFKPPCIQSATLLIILNIATYQLRLSQAL